METQGSESPRGDTSSSRRVLKMQTIPTETPERKRSTQQSFETDDEFQFRRHSAKKSQFGDRLQEFQSVKDARRVENFNSSFQVPPQSQEEHQQYTGQAFPPQYPAPTQLPSPQRMIPMPMVYYYAAANQQPGAVPTGTQPQQYAIPQQGMGINFQAMNQFIDPQYQEQQPYYQSLMPAPSFYPPPSSQEKLPNPLSQNRPILAPEDSRAKRKSFMIQRGRRLSLLNQENQLNDIISPHKDVHESEFYRYMNNSFAQDLKMKQLMNWCLIRALRKLEIKNSQNKSESRKITLTILKDFVRDIRKGSHDIDWDSEGPEAEPTVEDESEISNLFKEGNTENSILVDSSLSNKNKIPPIKLAKIPNEKNIQNKENVKILEEKIRTIKNEIEQWSKDLSDVKIPSYELPKPQTSIVKLPDNLQLTATTKESIHSDFQKRVDGLQETTRLLKSSSILLNETAGMKLQRLNGCIVKKRPEDKNGTKKLLRGLSRSLIQ